MNTFKGVISGFRRDADENCVLLGCYAASSGNSLTDVSGQSTGPKTSVTPTRYVIMQKKAVHFHSPLVSTLSTSFNIKNSACCQHSLFILMYVGLHNKQCYLFVPYGFYIKRLLFTHVQGEHKVFP